MNYPSMRKAIVDVLRRDFSDNHDREPRTFTEIHADMLSAIRPLDARDYAQNRRKPR
jgi:hypothetical protein